MTGSADAKLAPRWEWRMFGRNLAGLEVRIGPIGPAEPVHSEEIYLLNSSTPHSAKVRDGALDIKRLEEVDPNGLELWKPAFKGAFPLTAPMLQKAFLILDLPPPVFGRDAYPLNLFLSELVKRDAAFRRVDVNKTRRQFLFRDCAAEFVRVRICGDGEPDSFCVEHETPERILSALSELDLDPHANVNFPAGVARALAGAV
jgi:hypothetical protein